MAEASRSHPSQYVRLKKHASHSGSGAEDIRPGELNQPVAVPQVGLAVPRAILGFRPLPVAAVACSGPI
jgi:hypothetical protein